MTLPLYLLWLGSRNDPSNVIIFSEIGVKIQQKNLSQNHHLAGPSPSMWVQILFFREISSAFSWRNITLKQKMLNLGHQKLRFFFPKNTLLFQLDRSLGSHHGIMQNHFGPWNKSLNIISSYRIHNRWKFKPVSHWLSQDLFLRDLVFAATSGDSESNCWFDSFEHNVERP